MSESKFDYNPRKVIMDSHSSLLEDCKAFLNEVNKITRSVPEAVFVNTFLPMFFVGGVANVDGEKIRLPLTAWIEHYAGSAFNEVNVLDEKGNVLFAVPPMTISAGTYQSKLMTIPGVDINTAFADASMSIQNESDPNGHKLGSLSDRFLTDLEKTTEDVRETMRRRWIEIYMRYGLIPKESINQQNDDNDDSLYYSGETELL